MFRLLSLFLIVFAAGWCALWFLDRPGDVTIVWQGWEVRTTVAAGLLVAIVFIVSVLLITRIIFGLIRMPGQMARHSKEQTKEQGLQAISKGLIAIATGDLSAAKRFSKRARALVPSEPLTQVLLAQRAQLEGNNADAEKFFTAMLDNPETELLGRQGLVQHAINRGDRDVALTHARRAFQLRPKAKWAYQALLDHLSKANAWDEALETIEKGRQSKHLNADDAKFKKAVFLTAKAYAALEHDDKTAAETLAIQAQRLVPGFTPAAVLAARILIKKSAHWRASGILEEAWRAQPHPAIIETYAAIKPDENMRLRARRLSGLVEMRADHPESQLLRARIAINTHEWGDARDILAPLAQDTPTPRVCALMAEIEQGERNNIGAAREWMARAVAAPSEPEWLRTDFRFTASEWGELARDLTEWPPKFSERTFEKTIRIAPIHDQADILGHDGDGPEQPDTVTGDAKEDAIIAPSQVIISPLRSKQKPSGLVTKQIQSASGRLSNDQGTAQAAPTARKAKPVAKPKTAKPAAGPSGAPAKAKKAAEPVIFSLDHQPDDPGAAND